MSVEIKLGKIKSIHLGYGGYQEAQFGLSVDLGGDGWGVFDFVSGGWGTDVEPGHTYKWTEDDRTNGFAHVLRYVNRLLRDAKVKHLDDLANMPVEIIMKDRRLESWRILKEVL